MDCIGELVTVFLLYSKITSNGAVIEKMYVPEVVQSGSNDVVLCCQYSLPDNSSVHWLFNGFPISSNEWDSLLTVTISDIQSSRARYDSHVKPYKVKQSLLSLQRVTPDMSGNYTCQLSGGRKVVQQTKQMFVFSPENDFTLKVKHHYQVVDIKCTAWGLYPKPEMTLELNKRPISKQVQRVWWREDSSYTAEGSARLREAGSGRHEVTCRLHLPQADYTAIMKKYVDIGNEICCGSHLIAPDVVINVIILFAMLIKDKIIIS